MGREIVFFASIRDSIDTQKSREQASFLHNAPLGFPFPAMSCLLN